jgi:hypothetical protein
MKPTIQTKLHTDIQDGNCFETSLASILELPIEDIPEFNTGEDDWWTTFIKYLKPFNLYPVAININVDEKISFNGYYLVMGTSPRDKNLNHQVVYKNGKIVHDPHPSGDGILDIKEITLLVPLDPAKVIDMDDKDKIIKDLVDVINAYDGKAELFSNQGQALDGYSLFYNFIDIAKRARILIDGK